MSKIKIVEGNAIDAYLGGDIDILLHVANTQGKMGSGIAKEIRNRVPTAYDNYMYEHKHGGLNLGEVTLDDDGNCFNLHAQKDYGYDGKRYINYGALAECVHAVYNYILYSTYHLGDRKGLKIGFPYLMGCGLAGGEWSVVSEVLEHCLGDYELVAYELK